MQDLSYSILQDSRLKQQKLNSRIPIPVGGSIHGKSLGRESDVSQGVLLFWCHFGNFLQVQFLPVLAMIGCQKLPKILITTKLGSN